MCSLFCYIQPWLTLMNIPVLLKKYRKSLSIITGLIAFYTLLGFLILPMLVENQLPKLIESATGRKASIEKVSFNPYSLKLHLQGFSMQEKDLQTFVSFDEFFFNIQFLSSIKNLALVLEEVQLSNPYVRIAEIDDENYNFSDLSSDEKEEVVEEESEGMFPLKIHHLKLLDGNVEYIELAAGKSINTLANDLNIQLESFSTLLNDGADLSFSMALHSGGKLEWHGQLGVNPLFSNGEFNIEGLSYTKIWETFLQEKAQYQWVEGTQAIRFKYDYAVVNDENIFNLTEGHWLTENLKFTAQGSDEEVIVIPHFEGTGISLDLTKQTINIAKIESKHIDLKAWIALSGELNYKTLFAGKQPDPAAKVPNKAETTVKVADDANQHVINGDLASVADVVADQTEEQQPSTDEAKPWLLDIQEIALNTSTVNFRNKQNKDSTVFNLAALDIGVKDYHLSIGEPLLMTANQGYINLQDLIVTTGKDSPQDIIKLPFFAVTGVEFDLDKQAVDIAQIESKQAFFNAWINSAGIMNYQTAFAGPGTTAAEEETKKVTAKGAKPWAVNIQAINFNGSKVKYANKQYKETVFITVPTLDIGLKNYHLLSGEQSQMTANQGSLNLQGFELKTEKDKGLITVPNLQVANLGFNLQEKKLTIQSLKIIKAQLKAWIEESGTLNYQTLFASGDSETNTIERVAKEGVKKASPWLIELAEFKLENSAVEFSDHSPKKSVPLNVSALNLSVKNVSTQEGAKIPLSLSAKLNKTATIKVSGQTVLQPFSTALDIAVSGVKISNFQSYIEQSAKLDVVKGHVNTQGKLAASQTAGGQFKLSYKGGVEVKNLHTRDQLEKEDFLKWSLLKLSGINFNLQPSQLSIKSIKLLDPYARVEIKKDKTTNLDDIMVKKAETQPKKPVKKKKTTAAFTYKVGKIEITGGESDFSDHSMILPFVVKLNELDGAIDNISSDPKETTQLKLAGKTFDFSPVDVEGRFTSDFEDFDLSMHYTNLPLPLITPYMVDFSGDKIEKGKMSLDLHYQAKNGKLQASNKLFIDQLELGEKVDNPDAVSLPLGLAITLLKDMKGEINIEMPLSGDLDDPDFRMGPLILKTFMKLIVKVAASPFMAIGSILGSDEDFSVVAFDSGRAEITVEESKKLDGLATVLVQKPELSLQVKGQSYTNQDWPGLKKSALLWRLKKTHAAKLRAKGEVITAEEVELSADDYQDLLADRFIEKFPEMAKRSVFGTPKLIHEEMGEFYEVASNMLQNAIAPDPKQLDKLSASRAKAIASYMVKKGGIDHARIFILDTRVTENAKDEALNSQLSIKVK
ncbi:MAG: DUF748 domain-containing protein [Methyloprofundus sp.]|nr:DUF748 domain-containing protein [Methyloprofundus sp.]